QKKSLPALLTEPGTRNVFQLSPKKEKWYNIRKLTTNIGDKNEHKTKAQQKFANIGIISRRRSA
ncbi:MAG: hypothetical protein KAW12_10675, partial [Candidatus Aminicenantes bacterium]|nr:hypothetical protein [Candidatus Aminicenantes bacterium]